MNYQKPIRSLAASLALLMLATACGKNMSLQVDTSKLSGNGTTQGTTDNTIDASKVKKANGSSSTPGSSTTTPASTEPTTGATTVGSNDASTTGNTTATEPDADASSSTSASAPSSADGTDSASTDEATEKFDLSETGVLQPLSISDAKYLTDDLQILLAKTTRDQMQRKLARAVFKVRPYSSLIVAKSKKAGEVKATLVISKEDNNIDFGNFKVCLFSDIENDICRDYNQLVTAAAFIGDPLSGNEVQIDMLKAFGAKKADQKVKMLFSKTFTYDNTKYYRKVLLSIEGVKKVFGSKFIVESKDVKAKGVATPADYDESTAVGVDNEELTVSDIR